MIFGGRSQLYTCSSLRKLRRLETCSSAATAAASADDHLFTLELTFNYRSSSSTSASSSFYRFLNIVSRLDLLPRETTLTLRDKQQS